MHLPRRHDRVARASTCVLSVDCLSVGLCDGVMDSRVQFNDVGEFDDLVE